MKFKHLIQGIMSVLKYESCFAELSRFAMGMISEEGEKVRRFQQGLRLVGFEMAGRSTRGRSERDKE